MTLGSKRSVTVVAGLSGYGKNTFINRFLINADLSARFIFDPDPGERNPHVGEFADRLSLTPARTEYELGLHLVRGWVAFDPHPMYPGNPAEAVDKFCDWAYDISGDLPGEKVIVIDEIWKYCTPQVIPAGIRKAALSGRKPRLQLIVATQEPNRLNSTFKSGMSEVVCFRLQGDKSLDFAQEFGFNREEVAQLAPLHWVARNLDSGGELRGVIKV